MNELKSWQEEQRAAAQIRCSRRSRRSPRAHLFTELAGEAEGSRRSGPNPHARRGRETASLPTDLRTRIVEILTQRFVQGQCARCWRLKVRGSRSTLPWTLVIRCPKPVRTGARQRGLASGGNLRAAVFGVNDGLPSNASLIMGVVMPKSSNRFDWIAGLLAGAFSMSAGEYVSVRPAGDVRISDRTREGGTAEYPEEEASELALSTRRAACRRKRRHIWRTPYRRSCARLDALAREELAQSR